MLLIAILPRFFLQDSLRSHFGIDVSRLEKKLVMADKASPSDDTKNKVANINPSKGLLLDFSGSFVEMKVMYMVTFNNMVMPNPNRSPESEGI